MAHETIFIVEDEQDIVELLIYNLEKEGYTVHFSHSGEDAIGAVLGSSPDLILLDLMLPGMDGIEVCKHLKKDPATARIPIIMLTAKSEDSDVILGLEVGAEDYVAKPFSPKVLIARIRSVLRRHEKKAVSRPEEQIIRINGIFIDITKHQVKCGDHPVDLSATEFSILAFLAKNPGWVFSRSRIIESVKGEDYPVTERSVDVQILGLRKKMGAWGKYIQTVRGVGYKMQMEQGPE